MNLPDKIEENTKLFADNFAGLSETILKQKTAIDKWCIEEHIEHLIVINQTYFDVFEALMQKTYKAHFFSKIPGLANWFGNHIYRAMNPDSSKKIRTFPVWEPSIKNSKSDLAERFIMSQKKLQEYALKMQPFILNNTIISSPAKRFVVYSVSMAFEIILAHQLRHFQHCQAILKAG